MKKALASITLFCYLAVSCGVVINLHYCMGRVDSIQLFARESNVCERCGMNTTKSHKCCGDEIKIIKLQDDQQVAQAIHSMAVPVTTFTVPSDFMVTSFYNADQSVYHIDHSPPLLTQQDTYLQNCVFRI
jgi:hypothetical protein